MNKTLYQSQALHQKRGSSLMAVIIITVASITVIGAMTMLTSLVLYSVYGWQQSLHALMVAESLTDDIMLRIVRNPNLTIQPDEKFELNGAFAYPTLISAQTSGQPNALIVRGIAGDYVRSIRVLYILQNGSLEILTRQEIR